VPDVQPHLSGIGRPQGGYVVGFGISWCAVREEQADRFLKRLNLIPTGEAEEIPESPITSGRLDTGWRIVWYNEFGCPDLGPEELAKLSVDHDVLVCLVEEHVMASSSALWSDGSCIWSLSHEGEDGPCGLSIEGDAPECLASIRTEMEELQKAEGGDNAGVDYLFEIPLLVAKALVGFKHDENYGRLIGGCFDVMSRNSPKGAE